MLLDTSGNSWSERWGENVNIRMNSDVTLAILNKNSSILLYDVYDPGLGVRRKIVRNGALEPTAPCSSFNFEVSVFNRRKNMTGVVVRVAFLVTKNLTIPIRDYLKDRHNKNHDSIGKFNYELFEHLVEDFNFTLVSYKQ